jgi:hypothetical protein
MRVTPGGKRRLATATHLYGDKIKGVFKKEFIIVLTGFAASRTRFIGEMG